MHKVLFALCELYNAVRECKQSVVLASADVLARSDVRPTLTDDYLARLDGLPAVNLGSQTLTARITSIP